MLTTPMPGAQALNCAVMAGAVTFATISDRIDDLSEQPLLQVGLSDVRPVATTVQGATGWGWCWYVQMEASVRTPTVVVGHVRAQNLP